MNIFEILKFFENVELFFLIFILILEFLNFMKFLTFLSNLHSFWRRPEWTGLLWLLPVHYGLLSVHFIYNYSLLLRSIRVFMDLLISKVHRNSHWPIQKDCNCFITLKWKVKVKPSLRDFCKSPFYFCKPIACVVHYDYLFILK